MPFACCITKATHTHTHTHRICNAFCFCQQRCLHEQRLSVTLLSTLPVLSSLTSRLKLTAWRGASGLCSSSNLLNVMMCLPLFFLFYLFIFFNKSLPLLGECFVVLWQTFLHYTNSKNIIFCVCRIKLISNNVTNTAKSRDKRLHHTLAQMEDTKSDHEEYGVGTWTDLIWIIPMVGSMVGRWEYSN